ncbi:MAG: TonB-dependent receptor [Pseudomonadota bacterium]
MLHKRPLSLAVSAAIGASASFMSPAFAQDESLVEEVVVTGSRIQRANLVSSSPVTQLDAEQLALTGVTRVEDALAAIPGIQLEQSSGQAIEATGTATLELRRLGASRTLVLMNGRRLPVHSPSSTTSAADINLIPGQLVERVEVLTGGASSTYGADAVAGVVNFIMMDDFEGIKLDYQYSLNRHDNSAGDIAGAAERGGYPFATGTATDGEASNVTFIMGGNFDNGRGNATAFASYREIEGVEQLARDHSACPVRASGECLGSATNEAGTFFFSPDAANQYRVEGDEFLLGRGRGFNFAAPSYFQRPDERVTVGTFAHYDVNENVELYTELMFMDTKSTTQFGPAGLFLATRVNPNCGNPLLSDQQLDLIRSTGRCSTGDPEELFDIDIGRRAFEGGPRGGELRHTTYRGVFGARGNFNDTWRYDVSWQYSEVDMRNDRINGVYVEGTNQALNVVLDENGTPVCNPAGNPDADCVPWNIWETGGVTPEAAAFLSDGNIEVGTTSQEVFMAYVQGSLGDYGVVSPFAESGVELVLGAEYRDEFLRYTGSENLIRGTAGGWGTVVPVRGRFDVSEVYFEASIPVVEDAPFAQSVLLDVGYRYSDYDFGATTDTYKLAGSWQIVDDFKLRGSFQRAVRAPNIIDLFRPETPSLFAMDQEPCERTDLSNPLSDRGFTFEQCANTGVTRELWDQGGPVSNPASQYNDIEGGSPDIQPEEADTYTVGFIWTPGFVDGLSVSFDYYNIEIEGAIQGIQAETTLTQCLITGDPTFCSAVQRDELGSIWLSNPQTLENSVDARSTNIGFLAVTGFDVEVNYNFDIGDLGTINIANIAGFVEEYEQQEFPGAESIFCEGVYGGGCQLPTPELKNRFQATWATPWNVTANVTWRYIQGTDQVASSDPLDIDDMNYIDIAANWDVTDWAQLRLGINNLFDERPPRVYQGVTDFENGNTYPGLYDPLGQYIFAGFTVAY